MRDVRLRLRDDPNFLAGLDDRGQQYAVAVRTGSAVASARRTGEPPQRADAPMGALPTGVWHSVGWPEGRKGWLRGRLAVVRCWRVTTDGVRHIGWRQARGPGERREYFWSNFGPEVRLERPVGYVHRRHGVEQYYDEATGLLGWDQYRGRLWTGFHRHAVAVMLAYSFLGWEEFRWRWTRPRPGRPRPAFSPSPGPPPGAPPGGPPPRQRLGTTGGAAGVVGA